MSDFLENPIVIWGAKAAAIGLTGWLGLTTFNGALDNSAQDAKIEQFRTFEQDIRSTMPNIQMQLGTIAVGVATLEERTRFLEKEVDDGRD